MNIDRSKLITAASRFEASKASKWDSIKADRDNAEFGPFEYAGNLYDGTSQSKMRIIGAVAGAMLAVQAGDIEKAWEWTLADNSVITLTALQVIEMGNAAEASVQQAFERGRVLREMIEQATTQQELDAIQWEQT